MRSLSTVYKHQKVDHDAAFTRSTQARAAGEPSVPVPSASRNRAGQMRRLDERDETGMDLDQDMDEELRGLDEEVRYLPSLPA